MQRTHQSVTHFAKRKMRATLTCQANLSIVMALRTRKDYDRALAVVKAVIDEWDPLGLFGAAAPDNEWDSEVASVVAQIPRIGSPRDAAHAISRVFSSSLEPERFEPAECEHVGSRLFDALRDAGLLSAK